MKNILLNLLLLTHIGFCSTTSGASDFYVDKLTQPIKTVSTNIDKGKPRNVTHTEVGITTQSVGVNKRGINTVPVGSFDFEMARRQIKNSRSFFFFGENEAVGGSYEDIWPTGGDIPWQTAADFIHVNSSNVNDISTGSGGRSIEIHGLGFDGKDQDEIIQLRGADFAISTLSYCRLNKAHLEDVGTYGGAHQGDLTLRYGSSTGAIASLMTGGEGSVNGSVQYGFGEALNGFYSVPLGKILYITRIEVTPDVSTNKTVDIVLYEREGLLTTGSAPFLPRRVLWHTEGIDSHLVKVFKSHIKIKPLTDIWFRATGSASSKVEVYVDFYLVDTNPDGQ